MIQVLMEKTLSAFQAALKYELDKKGRGAQVRLTEALNLSSGYVSMVVRGLREGSPDFQRSAAEWLGYPGRKYEDFLEIGRDLLEGKEPPALEPQSRLTIIPRGISEEELESSDFIQIPFRDDMRLFAGGGGAVPGTFESDGSPVVIHRGALSQRVNSKDLVAFRVGGDSMEPILAKNGIVAVDTSQNDMHRLKEGEIYALCWDREEECAVKRLRWAVPGKLLAVESTDPIANPTIYLEPEDRAVYLIGRVIWSWREH